MKENANVFFHSFKMQIPVTQKNINKKKTPYNYPLERVRGRELAKKNMCHVWTWQSSTQTRVHNHHNWWPRVFDDNNHHHVSHKKLKKTINLIIKLEKGKKQQTNKQTSVWWVGWMDGCELWPKKHYIRKSWTNDDDDYHVM